MVFTGGKFGSNEILLQVRDIDRHGICKIFMSDNRVIVCRNKEMSKNMGELWYAHIFRLLKES